MSNITTWIIAVRIVAVLAILAITAVTTISAAHTARMSSSSGADYVVHAGEMIRFADDIAHEARLIARDALPDRLADRSQILMLGGTMQPHLWTFNGAVWGRPRHRPCAADVDGRYRPRCRPARALDAALSPHPDLATDMMTELAVTLSA